jgi:membrane associated rhomboid family serine protease
MVIPIHDENPVRRTPVVTYALIVINLVVFIFLEPVHHSLTADTSVARQECTQVRFFDEYAAIPREMLTDKPLPPHAYGIETQQGATLVCRSSFPHKNAVLSVLYAMFLHGGWLHILGNMLFLFIFGNNIEDRLGRVWFLLFYLIAGYIAAYGFALANRDSTTTLVGASGAIAGVLGAYLVLYPRARVRTLIPIGFIFVWPRLPAWVVLGLWFGLQYWYSTGAAVATGAGVAYLAHVVGFLFGALVALPLRAGTAPPYRPQRYPRYG